MEDDYWSFKDIIAHQDPLTKENPHYKGSSYNVMIKWDTGETSYEPLSLIIQDEPITCAVYAKKHGLLNTPGWKHLKKYVKTSKRLLRAAKQFKIRQVRKAIKYQFGYQVPRNYEDALRLDMENGNHKWQDAMDVEWPKSRNMESSRIMERQNGKERPSLMLSLDTRRSEFILFFQLDTVENLRGDWLLMAASPRNQWNLCTQELFLPGDSDWLCSLLNSTNSCYGEEMLAMLTLRHSPKKNSTSLLDLNLENSKDISSLSTRHYMEQGLEVHVGMTNSLTPSNTWVSAIEGRP